MTFKAIIGLVKLTPGRKKHIVEHHPIMEDYLDMIKLVLEEPEDIRYSNRSDDTLLFYHYFGKIENGKYIVVLLDPGNGVFRFAEATNMTASIAGQALNFLKDGALNFTPEFSKMVVELK